MTDNEKVDYDVDPESNNDESEGTGDESAYSDTDTSVEYDESQFELPEDYSEEDGEDNG